MKLFSKKDTIACYAVVYPVKQGNCMYCGVRVQPVEGKVNYTLEQAAKNQRGRRDIALLFFFNLGARWK
jgi:hypothetical protein